MKKGKNRSDQKLLAASDIVLEPEESIDKTPVDTFTVEVLALQTSDIERVSFTINVTFFDIPILDAEIPSLWARQSISNKAIAWGSMTYDPSDYSKMCSFADEPLVVTIEPITMSENSTDKISDKVSDKMSDKTLDKSSDKTSEKASEPTTESRQSASDAFSCNVDILTMFLGTDELYVKVRLQPVALTSVLNAISWDNLPLLTMKLSVNRDPMNDEHHNVLAKANYFKLTLIGCYNITNAFTDFNFIAASKTTMSNEKGNTNTKFYDGYKHPKRFSGLSFFPKWETMRFRANVNSQCSEKFNCTIENIQNEANIDLKKYFQENSTSNVIWASFHRTLLLKNTEQTFMDFIRQYSWPFELYVYDNNVDYSLMAFLDLFRLLYPGEDTIRMAVPLKWLDEALMKEKCDCDKLLEVTEKEPSTISNVRKSSKVISQGTIKTDPIQVTTTGNDDTDAFVVVEVTLKNPIKKPAIPPHINPIQINKMLEDMESQQMQRECTARGQLTKDWVNAVKMAANALRRISYYGSTDFCTFDRQFSSTRTRVEMVTSFCDEAAIYVNNNFVARDFLESDDTFKELTLMAHACLVREAADCLLVPEERRLDPTLRAARHAHSFQDVYHAVELYFQCVSRSPRDANLWRELATCLQDLDQEWADVCLDKSLCLNPRHPLTLLSKACMIFKKDPDAAEPFFLSLLFFHPFWVTGMVAANAYFLHRENFEMADAIAECIKTHMVSLSVQMQGLSEQMKIPRAWESELGDWWDATPLLPGMSLYYEAADLLLRLRAIKLAEVCVAQALQTCGDSPAYFHLLALCCRLKGDIDNALCHIRAGIKKYGEVSYLRTLEAECYHMQKNISASIVSLDKADTNLGSYSVLLGMMSSRSERCRSLLTELLRRQPSAYAWMAYAEEWILAAKLEAKKVSPKGEAQAIAYAVACATEALKIDKQAGAAWALLARFVKKNARKIYCAKMAAACGHSWAGERVGLPSASKSQPSLCQRVGKALRECQCRICAHLIL
ncbi:hypothetical protein RR46_13970 [Papilio xuthus]|uniref:Tetratricopeptide repeat protein 18 n=1 Tax=Papilio xuthus TaxID=66420 RepID=A0A194PJ51_PAPXU|nr:hypothetical protein RR46_13970 [Papilio xuthus]